MLQSHKNEARATVHFDFQTDIQTHSGQRNMISLEPDSISYPLEDDSPKVALLRPVCPEAHLHLYKGSEKHLPILFSHTLMQSYL